LNFEKLRPPFLKPRERISKPAAIHSNKLCPCWPPNISLEPTRVFPVAELPALLQLADTIFFTLSGVGRVHSLKRWSAGWTTQVRSPEVKKFVPLHSVQTESGAQSGRDVKLTTHVQLVQRSRNVELYLYSPICLHGIVRNYEYLNRRTIFYGTFCFFILEDRHII
jgi:hypothetical protein